MKNKHRPFDDDVDSNRIDDDDHAVMDCKVAESMAVEIRRQRPPLLLPLRLLLRYSCWNRGMKRTESLLTMEPSRFREREAVATRYDKVEMTCWIFRKFF